MSRANLFTVSRKPNILFSRKFWTYCKDIVVTHYRSWAEPFLRMFSIASLEHQEFLRLCSMMTMNRISWTRLHMIRQLWWEGSDYEVFNTFGAHEGSTHNLICSCMKACEIHITLQFEMSRPGCRSSICVLVGLSILFGPDVTWGRLVFRGDLRSWNETAKHEHRSVEAYGSLDLGQ
jgi:hypothetical protein